MSEVCPNSRFRVSWPCSLIKVEEGRERLHGGPLGFFFSLNARRAFFLALPGSFTVTFLRARPKDLSPLFRRAFLAFFSMLHERVVSVLENDFPFYSL